jgi:hypothetical protein
MTFETPVREIPSTDIDPFSMQSLADPFAADGTVREIAPVVYIAKHDYQTFGHEYAPLRLHRASN